MSKETNTSVGAESSKVAGLAFLEAVQNVSYALDMAGEDEVFAGSVCDITSADLCIILARALGQSPTSDGEA